MRGCAGARVCGCAGRSPPRDLRDRTEVAAVTDTGVAVAEFRQALGNEQRTSPCQDCVKSGTGHR